MKFRILVVLMALAVSASAQGKHGGSPDFKKLLQTEYDGWATLDTKNVAAFYAKDADLNFFDITPVKYKGWAEYERGVKHVLAEYKSMKLTVNDDVKGGSKGDMAWASATINFDAVHADGSAEHSVLRETAIYQRRDGTWLIVHEHVSMPLAAPAAAQKK